MKKKRSMYLLLMVVLFALSGCVQDLFFWVKEDPPPKTPVEQPEAPPPPPPAVKPEVALPAPPAVEERPVVVPVKPDAGVWEFLGRTKSGDTYYKKNAAPVSADVIAVSTYKIVTDDFRNQTIADLRKDSPKQSVRYQRYSHQIRIDEIDCALKRYRVKDVTHFDDQGTVLYHYAYENEGWQNIPVLTELDTLREKLCVPAKKPVKKKR